MYAVHVCIMQYLSNMMQSFLVLLSLSPAESQLHHSVLAIEEPALLPERPHLFQLVVAHILNLVDEDVLVDIATVTYLI